MHMFDADELLAAVAQSSKDFDLSGVSPHQTSRRRSERRYSPLCCEGDVQLRKKLDRGAVEWQAFSLNGAWSRRDS
jgi:hypothetical protein